MSLFYMSHVHVVVLRDRLGSISLARTPDKRKSVKSVSVKRKKSSLHFGACSVDSLESCETVRKPVRTLVEFIDNE